MADGFDAGIEKVSYKVKKNVLWHILAPSAVACDNLHLRASAHHRRVSAFLCNREFLGISYYNRVGENSS